MATDFDLGVLILPSFVIFISTFFVSFFVTKSPAISIVCSIVKSFVFFYYFYFIFDGRYTILDDWTYIEGGYRIIEEGVGLINVMDNISLLREIAGGSHFLYYLYNSYAFRVFGFGYYSPVAFNVILTSFIAYFGYILSVNHLGLTKKNGKIFFLFLLFHPDISSWSYVVNVKDILVLFFHVIILYSFSLFIRGKLLLPIFISFFAFFILSFLRFYVPLLFAASLFLFFLFFYAKILIKKLIISLVAILFFSYYYIGVDGIYSSLSLLKENFVNPFYGFIRFILTPIPFGTDYEYGFLNFSSIFNWAVFPLFCLGVFVFIKKWRKNTNKNKFCLYFVVYGFVFLALYAAFGELQGPRHRVQLNYFIAFFQFYGLIFVLRNLYPMRGGFCGVRG